MKAVALLASLSLSSGQDLFLSRPENSVNTGKKWKILHDLLSGWELTTEYAVSVGDASGPLFTYEGGNFTMNTEIPTGSTSKWPSAMMFAGLVDDGTIKSLDDPVSKYVPYWTKNASDLRSEVTMRTLLSFTSGFGGGSPGEEPNTRAGKAWRKDRGLPRNQKKLHERLTEEIGAKDASACDQMKGDVAKCAQSIYEKVELIGKPGHVYSYNSNHLTLAAGVAMAASGLDWKTIVQKYLVEPFNMHKSFYYGNCPDFAASLITTGSDYQNFLHGLLTYKSLSKEMIKASEQDYTPFMSDFYTLYGNYGFGHFLMCFDSVEGMTQACRDAQCHMDPGAYGFIPIIDRKYGYYVQVVSAEIAPTGYYPLSGIPEYVAVAIKPVVDAIISDDQAVQYDAAHHAPPYLSMSVADVNYCVDCKLHPSRCE